MFGDHYYHAILRKSVAVFGTLFNDISVVRKDSDGNIKDFQRVPLSYGPRQKFLSRIDEQRDLTDPKVAIKLPRMSFEITSLDYDSSTKLSQFSGLKTSSSSTSADSTKQIVPYLLSMQLNIIAKNQDDALQIIEQILPTFQPLYTVSVKLLDGVNESFDVPITLQSVALQDDYEGDYTQRRSLIYTLDFQMKIRFFGRISRSSVIREVIANVGSSENQDLYYASYTEATPDSATSLDEATVVNTVSFIPRTTEFSIVMADQGELSFTVGETVYGSSSAYEAKVVSSTYDQAQESHTLVVHEATGYFTIGENLVGESSTESGEITRYTVE